MGGWHSYMEASARGNPGGFDHVFDCTAKLDELTRFFL